MIGKRFITMIAVIGAIITGGALPAAASAHVVGLVPHITANGCTVKQSSLAIFREQNQTNRPGVEFTIDCITSTQWNLKVQCEVSPDLGQFNYSQCANTSQIVVSSFNAGGTYIQLVGNGHWGCNPNSVYRARATFGVGWAVGPATVLC